MEKHCFIQPGMIPLQVPFIKVNMQGIAKPVKLSKAKAIYRLPSFSPDGKWIVFSKEGGSNELGPAFTAKPGIYLMSADGTEEKFVTEW